MIRCPLVPVGNIMMDSGKPKQTLSWMDSRGCNYKTMKAHRNQFYKKYNSKAARYGSKTLSIVIMSSLCCLQLTSLTFTHDVILVFH